MLNHGDKIFYFTYLILHIFYFIYPGLNQINLIICTTKFETFLLDPIFKKQNMFSLSYQISLPKNTQSKFQITASEEKYKKLKLQMNEHEIFLWEAFVMVCLHLSYL